MDIEGYLKSFFGGTKNPNLDVMNYFMNQYGNPEKKLKFIHIAGTNGKGSITEMLSNILVKAGYKTGKFMSPHLLKYNERMSINNKNISDKEMEELLEELAPQIDEYNDTHEGKVTLFELETIMAMIYFSRNNCDIVVLETGLGGLHDCTNIVESSISIISTISYDHINILGNTLPEIAEQKAGIIKENGHTIFALQENEVNEVIENTCKEKNSKLHKIDPKEIVELNCNQDFTKFNFKNYENIEINLKGQKQLQNAAICLECIEVLKSQNYQIDENVIREGLKTVVHKARFEKLCKKPTIIFDGAHNDSAIENLKNTIHTYYPKENKLFVISILKKKDAKQILKELLKEDAIFIFTSGNNGEWYTSKEELYETAQAIDSNKELQKHDLNTVISYIKENYENYVTFVVGSFYVYVDIVNQIKG